jgi:hypothetical protein
MNVPTATVCLLSGPRSVSPGGNFRIGGNPPVNGIHAILKLDREGSATGHSEN